MSGITVYYFPFGGRAEQIRLALAEAGQTWTEGGGNLPALRESGVATFGSLPILDHQGTKIAQGPNCAFFVGQKYGFGGETEEERADIMQFALAAEDFRCALINTFYFKKMTNEELMAENGPGRRWLSCFERLLDGKDFLSCGRFTVADICLYDTASTAAQYCGVDLSEFPRIKAHSDRVSSRPNIAAYLANKPY